MLQGFNFVLKSLNDAGFVVNKEKSVWKPCQELLWSGLVWNSSNHFIQIPPTRVSDLISNIDQVVDCLPDVSARKLGRITGRVISMSPVLGNVTRLMTRHLY